MRLGITVPFRPDLIVDAARRIDAAGFDSVWLPDAHNRGFLLPDAFAALAMVTAVAPRLEVGTAVMQVPLRPPLELAQRVATLTVAAGGRFCFGVGAGSTEADHVGMGLDFADRFTGFDRCLGVIDRLLRAGTGTEGGDGARGAGNGGGAGNGEDEGEAGLTLGKWSGVGMRPEIVVGGRPGGRWFRRAARAPQPFQGWMGSMRSATADELCAGLVEWRAQAGARRALVSTIPNGREDVAEVLAQLADAGFDDAIIFADRHDDAELARLRSLVG